MSDDPFTPGPSTVPADTADVAQLRDTENLFFHYLIHEVHADGTPKLCTGRKHQGLLRRKRGAQLKAGLEEYRRLVADRGPFDGPVAAPAGGARAPAARPAPAGDRAGRGGRSPGVERESTARPTPERAVEPGHDGLFIPGEPGRLSDSGPRRQPDDQAGDGGSWWSWGTAAVTVVLVGAALIFSRKFLPTPQESEAMGLHPVSGRTGGVVQYLQRILADDETGEKVKAAGRFVKRLVFGSPKPREDMQPKEGADDGASEAA